MKLTAEQRKLVDNGKALVSHCPACGLEFFHGALPMDAMAVVSATRRAKCPTDKKHKLFMGPLPAGRRALAEGGGDG